MTEQLPPPPPPRREPGGAPGTDPLERAAQHVQILAVCFLVFGTLAALLSCIPVIHVMMGGALLSGRLTGPDDPAAPLMGWLFICIGSGAIALGWAYGLATVYAGWSMMQHRRWTYCLVMACISCLSVPLGTILGVFTLVVLVSDPGKRLFGK